MALNGIIQVMIRKQQWVVIRSREASPTGDEGLWGGDTNSSVGVSKGISETGCVHMGKTAVVITATSDAEG